MGYVPIDRWFRDNDAARRAGVNERTFAQVSNMMSEAPFRNDAAVILTAGAMPDGRVPHGAPNRAIPNPTGLRFGVGPDGLWAIERDPNRKARVRRATTNAAKPAKDLGPKQAIVPDVVRFRSIVGTIGNVE